MFVLVRASRVQRNALYRTPGCCAANTHTFTQPHTHTFKLTLKYQQQCQRSVNEGNDRLVNNSHHIFQHEGGHSSSVGTFVRFFCFLGFV